VPEHVVNIVHAGGGDLVEHVEPLCLQLCRALLIGDLSFPGEIRLAAHEDFQQVGVPAGIFRVLHVSGDILECLPPRDVIGEEHEGTRVEEGAHIQRQHAVHVGHIRQLELDVRQLLASWLGRRRLPVGDVDLRGGLRQATRLALVLSEVPRQGRSPRERVTHEDTPIDVVIRMCLVVGGLLGLKGKHVVTLHKILLIIINIVIKSYNMIIKWKSPAQ